MFMVLFILLLVGEPISVQGEDCGPIGYNARELLGPSYWFFDLNSTDCPPIPPSTISFVPHDLINSTCRIYFNLCQNMNYQCYGTVCVNYLDTLDFIARLGVKKDYPFTEVGDDSFQASYDGDALPCKDGLKKLETSFIFQCSHTNESIWSRNVKNAHGGSKAPNPVSVEFDRTQCKYTLTFNYTDACFTLAPGDTKVKTISTGSLILILFFPSIALYFIMGILLNRARNKEGKDLIPHRYFWAQLPELIMDGLYFTMAMLTCQKEDRYLKDYEKVDS